MHFGIQLLINFDTRRRYAFFVFVAILGISTGLNAQSKVFDDLRKSKLANRTFVLYPSTIRMINVPQLESYYKAFEHIDKVSFFKLRKDFTEHDYLQTVAKLEDTEAFEELMHLDQSAGDDLLILHREESAETVMLSQRDGQFYAASILGQVDLLQLTALVGDLQNPEIIADNPLLKTLYDSGFAKRKDKEQDEEDDEDKQSPEEKKSKT